MGVIKTSAFTTLYFVQFAEHFYQLPRVVTGGAKKAHGGYIRVKFLYARKARVESVRNCLRSRKV